MDQIPSIKSRNPNALLKSLGGRLREHRLARGWTQAELSERAGVALSTLKLLEARGHGSLQRVARIAVALGLEGGLRDWFARPPAMESIEAVKRTTRLRAPRRKPPSNDKEACDGTDG